MKNCTDVMRKRKRRFLKGSYTVEAAFVLPLVVGILLAVIIMGFYMQDKIIIQDAIWEMKESYKGNMAGGIEDIGKKTEKKREVEEWKACIQKKCRILQIKKISIIQKKNKVKITGKAGFACQGILISRFLKKVSDIEISFEISQERTGEYMRRKKSDENHKGEEGETELSDN